ncbi:MAG: DNA polymerase/3'-5' exonuclease PolX, partial [Planctomycetota bacterium]
LGPKTVKLLWEKAGVTDVPSLVKAMDAGELEKLPRMGAKTIQNIRESLEFVAKAGDRSRLGQALPVAEAIVASLEKIKGTKQVAYAGSLRRGRETIGDIDILASSTQPKVLSKSFREMQGVTKVLAAGETKSSVRLEAGIQVDLRVVDDATFGAALLYFTGSKQHNVVLRERAIKMGFRLNEYGLFPDDDEPEPPQQRGVKPVARKTEAQIYQKLDLPLIPPELREDRGEIGATLPTLLELDDIKAELHAHTIASDGKMTIEELAQAAKARGFHTVAVTDHSKSSIQANGLDERHLRAHIEAIREADATVKGITILAGSEVDILGDGHLDYDDDLLAELDIVVASPHVALRQDPKKATKRLLKAIAHPLVHILGHPTGRLINTREGLHPDIEALVAAAIEHDTALEINASFMRLDLRDVHVKAAADAGALIAINTDAHAPEHLEFLRYGVLTARRGWLTKASCVNAWTKPKLAKWLQAKR